MKRSLGAFLLACRIQSDLLETLEFIQADELPKSRLRSSHRASASSIQGYFKIPPAFIQTITHLAQSEILSVRVICARFLFALLVCQNAASFVEQAVVIRQSDQALISTAYRFFDPALCQALASIRMPILLKFVSVSPDLFPKLIKTILTSSASLRWLNLDYLFALSTTTYVDPSIHRFVPTSLQLRAYLCTPAIYAFFDSVYDQDKDVRLKTDILIDSLRPTQLETIGNALTTAFQASLSEIDRNRLSAFLLRLRAKCPNWQILSLRTIIDAVYELMEQANPASSENDLELKLLLLGLSYMKVASPAELTRLKLPLVQHLGFTKCVLDSRTGSPEVLYSDLVCLHPTDSLACLHALKKALDCPRTIQLKRMQNNNNIAQQEKTLIAHCLIDIPFRLSEISSFCRFSLTVRSHFDEHQGGRSSGIARFDGLRPNGTL